MMKQLLSIILLFGVGFVYLLHEYNRNESSELGEMIHSYNGEYSVKAEHDMWQPHKLAVLIPFRDAFGELIQLVPALDDFLNKQLVRHDFIVMHQVDTYRFDFILQHKKQIRSLYCNLSSLISQV